MTDVSKLANSLIGVGITVGGADATVTRANYPIDRTVAGGASDGTTAVYVAITGPGAAATLTPYLDSLTSPVAGQMVCVLIINNSPLILGRVIGLP